ncbi:unnamed protein product [Microthlaspi erraticum]|uniref:Reverse transcriptase zinc-binding domain-containing protein n=1 Tax=Microthlaspi erraticum TaxID=1685480 RepID=A0A6D2K250_9BRAS|nr:unnamed protein product [Microthlaspi erraticum]
MSFGPVDQNVSHPYGLLLFYKVEVHNGQRTSFWYDNWSPLGTLIDITGPRGFIDLGITSSKSVADALTGLGRRRHRTEQLRAIQVMLNSLCSRSMHTAEDIPLWKASADVYKPSFSTKNTWIQLRHAGPVIQWHRGVWFTHSTPKLCFFAWLAMHNRLATGDRMLSWNAGVNATCLLCQQSVESRNHLFFACRYSAAVWSVLTKGLLKGLYTTNWNALVSVISNTTQPRHTQFLIRYVFQATIHGLLT